MIKTGYLSQDIDTRAPTAQLILSGRFNTAAF